MKVLLISYHFPPDPAVGSTRTGRVARSLREAGHEVHVIAPGLDVPGPETGHATAVHRVRRRRNAREIALDLRNSLRRSARVTASAASAPDAGYIAPDNVPQWKRFLVAMALFPDDQQGFILPAVFRARQLHRRHRFDLVYSSGPPHSAHVAGLILKRLLRVRWAAEFRDPWTDNAVKARFARSDTALAMKRWLERKSLSLADHIIAVSEAAGRLFAAKAGTRAGRVLVVRNGIDFHSNPAGTFAPGPATRITYLGNLYHRRDPRPLMRALAALRRSGEVGNRPVELAFYGQCRWYHDVSLEQEALSLGIADSVSFHEPIPRTETAAVMASSDLLLLFAQEQPLQIPQKLYEYFAAHRPILAFADRDGETASMLDAAGGHFVIHDEDPDQVRAVLARALRGEPDSVPRFDPLLEWSTAREFGRLVAALEAGFAGHPPTPHLLRERDSSGLKNEVGTTVGQ